MATPKYRKKPGRDFAYVEFRGIRYRLPGAYDSKESRDAYREFLSSKVFGSAEQREAPSLTVAGLVYRYLDFASTYYKPGARMSEYVNLRATLHWFGTQYGHIQAREFGPLMLKEVQKALVAKKHSRNHINQEISRIRRAFRWAVSEQLVLPGVLEALKSVDALRKGHTEARETAKVQPVEWEVVCETLAYCSPSIADMVLVQWHTGVRSDSLCRMAWEQIDRSVVPWIWTPRHKTEHLDAVVQIPIGPRCKRVLERHEGEGVVFRPTDVGKHPAYTGEYTSASYYQHIKRALDRAKSFGHKIPHWHPHQIRHSRERVVERVFGIEGARTALAHASLDATQIYSSRDLGLAVEIAMRLG